MRKPIVLLAILGAGGGSGRADSSIPNPRIDMAAYLKIAQEAAAHRESHRVTEAQFLAMSRDPGTVILDARSRDKFDLLHIRGAINLSFPDIAIDSLAKMLPDKNARILIYCNNNFTHEPEAFPAKAPAASLNVSTYISLYSYGYRNVWELGPLLDVHRTTLPLEPTRR
ncbi:MAG TPA: rhodanese-like domain-containing protein [Polyangia bacterium]|nr:rhodanese-like domain-containing protein [Polyangia bacterium]